MILVCGRESGIRTLLEELDKISSDYLFWDPENFRQTRIDLNLGSDGSLSGTLVYRNCKYDLNEFRVIYNAVHDWGKIIETNELNGHFHRQQQSVYILMQTFIENTTATVLRSKPEVGLNQSGTGLLQLADESGMKISAFVMTTNPETAAKFYISNHGQVLFRSVDGTEPKCWDSIHPDTGMFSRIGFCPTLIQQIPPGERVRVGVVNSMVLDVQQTSVMMNHSRPGADMLPDSTRANIVISQVDERALAGMSGTTGNYVNEFDCVVDEKGNLVFTGEALPGIYDVPDPVKTLKVSTMLALDLNRIDLNLEANGAL